MYSPFGGSWIRLDLLPHRFPAGGRHGLTSSANAVHIELAPWQPSDNDSKSYLKAV
jgi:hypothetical protein